ncbi:hypothetical protein BO79DRAFT_252261 [Aspergillus costaricaensis CBS 115574]|uniref:Uncharacterized protein n=1 Tax=Aspergillus costaricaensis CBS 115574 TaxID=1448317 RepID=A0ACD1IMU7_9EURO|nr:hypothetical protein BO79DRAFT_252261 [Aspergillus costaricaensis CBS 115574]RAK91434.1 hypothetical protein BO79DRAFT_252261 [Aspergillus costaricaensis CBS 115574]
MQTTSQRQGDCVSSQQAAGAFATSSDLFSRFSADFRRPSSCVSVARRPPYRSTLDRFPDLDLPQDCISKPCATSIGEIAAVVIPAYP